MAKRHHAVRNDPPRPWEEKSVTSDFETLAHPGFMLNISEYILYKARLNLGQHISIRVTRIQYHQGW
jgi:hypothetical protein